MKFSVIVPVYNTEKFLAKCLDSIIDQDYDDYEIIAVNDGSTDSSPEILAEYVKKSDKIRVINQNNKGLGGARNTAIESSNGEFLVFVDSDDFISKQMLSTLSKYFDDYNLDILSFDLMSVNSEYLPYEGDCDNIKEFFSISKKDFMISEPTACSKAYRRSLFVQNQIKFPEHLWYEDLATIYCLVPYTTNIGYLKYTLYYYVQHNNSITHSPNTIRMMEIIKAFDILQSYYNEHGYFFLFYDELEWLCIKHVLYYSSHRFLTKGYYKNQMYKLRNYLCLHFPEYKSNKYLQMYKSKTYCMDWIIKNKFFLFYFKNCLIPKLINFFKKFLSE